MAAEQNDSNPKADADASDVEVAMADTDQQLIKKRAGTQAAGRLEPISAIQFFWTVVAGLMFGWALQKCGVGMADVIIDQFVFTKNTMLVMFLTASATSAVCIAVLKTFEASKATAEKSGAKYLTADNQGLPAVALGGTLIGVGMSISGTCPGTIWAQLGSGQAKAVITFAGALVGSIIVALAHKRVVKPFTEMHVLRTRTIAALFGLSELSAAAAVAVVFLGVVTAVLTIPGFYKPLPGAEQGFGAEYWHPMIGGVIVGLVQLPLTLGVGKNLGASTSFSVIAGGMMHAVGLTNDYTRPLISGKAWWSIMFVAIATIGAALSAWSGNTWYTWDQMEVSEIEAFLGGVVLLLGARIASGCTSGHGISGVGHGAIASIIGVAGIFLGGIITAACYGRF